LNPKIGRPPKSDAEKRLKGTFDPRFSEAARAANLQGNVVALRPDVVSSLPECPNSLSGEAKEFFLKWTRRLYETGKLTELLILEVETAAAAHQNIRIAGRAGKSSKGGDMTAIRAFINKMTYLSVDTPAALGDAKPSKWAAIGFAPRGKG
jgi:hypothetical protein